MSKNPLRPKADIDSPEPVRVAGAKCARCGQPVQARFRPFCSQRCVDVDLGQWASGGYRIPTADAGSGPDDGDTEGQG